MRLPLVVAVLLLMLQGAMAHVPEFGTAGTTPETALSVPNPTKSWVFFEADTHPADSWYTFQMRAGDAITLSIQVPAGEDRRPTAWLFGPGLSTPAPTFAPAGTGAIALIADNELSVEPFTPLAMRRVAAWDGAAPEAGTYYVLVRAPPDMTYSLGVGSRESFTPTEWVMTPVERLEVVSWGGIPWPVALLGEAAGIAVASWYGRAAWRARQRRLIGLLGAGAIAGTAVTVSLLTIIAVVQAGFSGGVIIPAVFALVALGIGYAVWKHVQRAGNRWIGAAWAAVALALWAGLILGPLLVLLWAVWPGDHWMPRTIKDAETA